MSEGGGTGVSIRSFRDMNPSKLFGFAWTSLDFAGLKGECRRMSEDGGTGVSIPSFKDRNPSKLLGFAWTSLDFVGLKGRVLEHQRSVGMNRFDDCVDELIEYNRCS